MGDNQSDLLFDGQNFESSRILNAEESAVGEQADLELHGIHFPSVSVPGLTPVELFIVAKMVNKVFADLEKNCRENPSIGSVDTVRLALLTAFKLASDLYQMQQNEERTGRALDKLAGELEEGLSENRGHKEQ